MKLLLFYALALLEASLIPLPPEAAARGERQVRAGRVPRSCASSPGCCTKRCGRSAPAYTATLRRAPRPHGQVGTARETGRGADWQRVGRARPARRVSGSSIYGAYSALVMRRGPAGGAASKCLCLLSVGDSSESFSSSTLFT
jgi:hypothetical protein